MARLSPTSLRPMALAFEQTAYLPLRGGLESGISRVSFCESHSGLVRLGFWLPPILGRSFRGRPDRDIWIRGILIWTPRTERSPVLEVSSILGIAAHRNNFCLPSRKSTILSHHLSFAPRGLSARFFATARALELERAGTAGHTPFHYCPVSDHQSSGRSASHPIDALSRKTLSFLDAPPGRAPLRHGETTREMAR